ncbi:uncharacterized protein LOC131957306 [Physella acuta]|uniref:uncharacterized protein LOC131957306 n=1 Tax=Physella acuta TaxID=109671 RepID=UPI0027DD5AC2|nr:uncharacterized protein LOC131957306 [Physella acuta]
MGSTDYEKPHPVLCIIFWLIDTADLVFDWWFFRDVFTTTHTLKDLITLFILIFCIVGTITYVVETVNYCLERWDPDTVSAVVVWVEDVPQMVLSLLATLYIGEVTTIQQVKLAVVAINFVTLVIVLLRECCCGQGEKVCTRAFIILATLIELGIAIAIVVIEYA